MKIAKRYLHEPLDRFFSKFLDRSWLRTKNITLKCDNILSFFLKDIYI